MLHVEVIPATLEERPVIANLLELYAHDFSEFRQLELQPDGRFGYPHLPLYWSEPDRRPFLIRVDGRPAGFVLVKKGSEVSGNGETWDLAEFFVVRGHRRRGVGTEVAHEVWRQLPGLWEVRVMDSNRPALHFWERAISAFTGEAVHSVGVDKGGERWRLFSFESKAK